MIMRRAKYKELGRKLELNLLQVERLYGQLKVRIEEMGSSSYKVRIGGGGIVGVGQRACNRSEGEWLRGGGSAS